MAYSYDDRDREFGSRLPPRPPRKEDNDLGSWILIIFLFIVAWPGGTGGAAVEGAGERFPAEKCRSKHPVDCVPQ